MKINKVQIQKMIKIGQNFKSEGCDWVPTDLAARLAWAQCFVEKHKLCIDNIIIHPSHKQIMENVLNTYQTLKNKIQMNYLENCPRNCGIMINLKEWNHANNPRAICVFPM